MNYANVDRVYRTVKYFYNKNQHGNLNIAEYNRFCDFAQRSYYRDKIEDYRKALRLRRSKSQHEGGTFSSYNDILQDIRTVHVEYLSLTSPGLNNEFEYPSDYELYTQISTGYRPVDIISQDDDEFNYMMTISDLQPSAKFPVVVMGRSIIKAMPSTITSLEMSYFKTPQGSDSTGNPVALPPSWAYTTVAGVEAYNASASVHFELPTSAEPALSMLILKYFGINLREGEILQYVNTEEQKEEIKQAQ